MKQKTFLFFPIEVGLAHIARSLGVAEELHERGHRVIFALPKRKQRIFAKSPVTFVDVPSYVEIDHEMVVKTFGDFRFLKRQTEADLRLIRRFRPDVAVVDYRISALAAAYISGTKAAFITNGSIVPCGSHIPNPGMSPLLYSLLKPLVERGLQLGMRMFLSNLVAIVRENGKRVDLEDWFESIAYLIPEPAGYYPPHKNSLRLVTVGPLTWKGFEDTVPDWLRNIKPDGKTVYMTFGGTGFNGRRLVELAGALEQNGYRVIVATGAICSPDDFPKRKNLFAVRYLPGKEVCRRVDLVICHGGFGTLMEAISAGKPVVAIPFNPDQVNHAARMQELGLGRSLFRLNLTDIFSIFSFRWGRIEKKSRAINLDRIVAEIKSVSRQKENYRKSFRRFFDRYDVTDGEKRAARFLYEFAEGK